MIHYEIGWHLRRKSLWHWIDAIRYNHWTKWIWMKLGHYDTLQCKWGKKSCSPGKRYAELYNRVERIENRGGPQRQYFEISWVYIRGCCWLYPNISPYVYIYIYTCIYGYNTSPDSEIWALHQWVPRDRTRVYRELRWHWPTSMLL